MPHSARRLKTVNSLSNPKKIAVDFVLPSLSRLGGGIVSSAARLAQNLMTGADVAVAGLADPFTAEDLENWSPLRPTAFRVLGPRAFGFAPRLAAALRQSPRDLIHTHGLWLYPSIATRKAGRPCLITPHGMLDAWALQNSRGKKRIAAALFENAHLRHAACLHALCQAEAESIRAYGLRNPICIIPNGVDLPSGSSSEIPPWPHFLSRKKCLLYLGRIHPKKGLLNLLHAWKAVGQTEWHLIMAGWDQNRHEEELKTLTQGLGLASSIHFAGPLFGAKKAAAYANADAFILPSVSEGLPMVILEAWAYEKPVVMTAQCNLPEGFSAGAAIRIGIDPSGIEAGLRELFHQSDEEHRRMGARGRELAASRFSWAGISGKMLAVYQWILGRGPRPDSVSD